MDNYLIDRQILERFVDELLKKNPARAAARADLVQTLDDKISMAIFGQFTEAQNTEFNQLLDDESTGEEAYDKFFEKAGIDVEQTMINTMNVFAADFMKGAQNV